MITLHDVDHTNVVAEDKSREKMINEIIKFFN